MYAASFLEFSTLRSISTFHIFLFFMTRSSFHWLLKLFLKSFLKCNHIANISFELHQYFRKLFFLLSIKFFGIVKSLLYVYYKLRSNTFIKKIRKLCFLKILRNRLFSLNKKSFTSYINSFANCRIREYCSLYPSSSKLTSSSESSLYETLRFIVICVF